MSIYAEHLFKADKRLGPDFLTATEFYGVLRGLYDPKKRCWRMKHLTEALR